MVNKTILINVNDMSMNESIKYLILNSNCDSIIAIKDCQREVGAMIVTEAKALRVLVEDLIDYAGLFPPAKLPMDKAIERYEKYARDENAWMLRWFVVPSEKLDEVPKSLNGKLSIISKVDEPRAATIETKAVLAASKPVYCEVDPIDTDQLDKVKKASNFAKIRCGGLSPEFIPSPAVVANFIVECAKRKLPFKATAGLHHAIRSSYPLTYEPDCKKACMHGFLNVLMAAAFAWKGEKNVLPILEETDPQAFTFGDKASWKDLSITAKEIEEARKSFFHSIGSCSFEEPVEELRALKLL